MAKTEEINSCIVEKIDDFSFRGHLCIVFELLSVNLYDLIKSRQFKGLVSSIARRITTQLLIALKHSHNLGIIHSDLKPENIAFKSENKSGIKLIDFGSTCRIDCSVNNYIQSRFYRAPEVILQYGYNEKIDIWSLGCVIVEMITGWPLFSGDDEIEMIQMMVNTIGLPADSIVSKAKRLDKLGLNQFVGGNRNEGFLNSEIDVILEGQDSDMIDFVKKCIVWDYNLRISAVVGLQHPWIKGKKNLNS